MALLSQSALGPTSSSASYSQNKVSNPEEGLRKVTIHQLLNAVSTSDTSRPFTVDGYTINKVMLVANVYHDSSRTSPGHSATCRTYGLDDGSGRLLAYSYDVGGGYIFEAFEYARIVGELVNECKGSKTFRIFNIQPIYDPHEIYFHILHSIFDSLILRRGPPPREVSSNAAITNSANNALEISLDSAFQQLSVSENVTIRASRPRAALSSTSHDSSSSPLPTDVPLTQLHRDILRCLSNPSFWQEKGVHVEDLVGNIKIYHPSILPRELSDSLEYLIEAGRISYADDWYYRVLLDP